MTQDQYRGCLLGLASGDALGAPYEGGFLEHCLWRLIGRTAAGEARWTDDTQMTLDLAESLLAHMPLDQADLARRFANSYRWRRGYGPGAARVLKRIRKGQDWQTAARAVYPQGSFGNGAAMRAPVLALFFADDVALLAAAHASAEVTHGHPLAIAGAQLMAISTKCLLQRQSIAEVLTALDNLNLPDDFTRRLQLTRQWLATGSKPGPAEVARSLGNGMTAATSCVTALYIALRHLECGFEQMMDFVIGCGGDVDTLGAMAGALWGVRNGAQALPQLKIEAWDQIDQLAQRIFHSH
ncbi:MAG: ADP-ribosyl-[dinitrogen reductase] glycohydrolase [Pseudomonadota bacterium]